MTYDIESSWPRMIMRISLGKSSRLLFLVTDFFFFCPWTGSLFFTISDFFFVPLTGATAKLWFSLLYTRVWPRLFGCIRRKENGQP